VPKIATLILALCLVTVCLVPGCAEPRRSYPEGVLAADYKLMPKAELLRYQDRLEDEIVRVGTGGSVPAGLSRETYAGDLRQRMKDVQHEIGLRNIWERKSYRERMEMNGPTR